MPTIFFKRGRRGEMEAQPTSPGVSFVMASPQERVPLAVIYSPNENDFNPARDPFIKQGHLWIYCPLPDIVRGHDERVQALEHYGFFYRIYYSEEFKIVVCLQHAKYRANPVGVTSDYYFIRRGHNFWERLLPSDQELADFFTEAEQRLAAYRSLSNV